MTGIIGEFRNEVGSVYIYKRSRTTPFEVSWGTPDGFHNNSSCTLSTYSYTLSTREFKRLRKSFQVKTQKLTFKNLRNGNREETPFLSIWNS